MIASFGRHEMRECNGEKKKGGRRMLHYKIIWFNFKIPRCGTVYNEIGSFFARVIRVISRRSVKEENDSTRITTGVRARARARARDRYCVMCFSIKLRENEILQKGMIYETDGGIVRAIFCCTHFARTNLIVNGNQFRETERIAKNSRH